MTTMPCRQGDWSNICRLGDIFTYNNFSKITEVAQIFGPQFFKNYLHMHAHNVLDLTKCGLGYLWLMLPFLSVCTHVDYV
jgi:hypothetical protein